MEVTITKKFKMSDNQVKEFMLRNGYETFTEKQLKEQLDKIDDYEFESFTTHDSVLDTDIKIFNLKSLANLLTCTYISELEEESEQNEYIKSELKKENAVFVFTKDEGMTICFWGAIEEEIDYFEGHCIYENRKIEKYGKTITVEITNYDEYCLKDIIKQEIKLNIPYEKVILINEEDQFSCIGAVFYLKDLKGE